jgi:glutathionylspermidine synthase
LTSEEISKGFATVLYDSDNDDREDDAVEEDFKYDSLKKKVMKRRENFTDVELAICDQFNKLLSDKIGFDSKAFRLKLEESKDAKYIQILDRFVEKAGVERRFGIIH